MHGSAHTAIQRFAEWILWAYDVRAPPLELSGILRAPSHILHMAQSLDKLTGCLKPSGVYLLDFCLAKTGTILDRTKLMDPASACATSGIYVHLFSTKAGTTVSSYVGSSVSICYRTAVHQIQYTLCASDIGATTQHHVLPPQYIHQVAAANDLVVDMILVATVPANELAFWESAFIFAMGSYPHPAWLKLRSAFMLRLPLPHGSNLTPAYDQPVRSSPVDELKSAATYQSVLRSIQTRIKGLKDTSIAERVAKAFIEPLKAHYQRWSWVGAQIFAVQGALGDAQDEYDFTRCLLLPHETQTWLTLAPSTEIVLLEQFLGQRSVPSAGYVSDPPSGTRAERARDRARVCELRGKLHDKLQDSDVKVGNDLNLISIRLSVIRDREASTFSAILATRPEMSGLGVGLEWQPGDISARAMLGHYTTGHNTIHRGASALADLTWSLLDSEEQAQRMEIRAAIDAVPVAVLNPLDDRARKLVRGQMEARVSLRDGVPNLDIFGPLVTQKAFILIDMAALSDKDALTWFEAADNKWVVLSPASSGRSTPTAHRFIQQTDQDLYGALVLRFRPRDDPRSIWYDLALKAPQKRISQVARDLLWDPLRRAHASWATFLGVSSLEIPRQLMSSPWPNDLRLAQMSEEAFPVATATLYTETKQLKYGKAHYHRLNFSHKGVHYRENVTIDSALASTLSLDNTKTKNALTCKIVPGSEATRSRLFVWTKENELWVALLGFNDWQFGASSGFVRYCEAVASTWLTNAGLTELSGWRVLEEPSTVTDGISKGKGKAEEVTAKGRGKGKRKAEEHGQAGPSKQFKITDMFAKKSA
ncbi:hypothetical protein V8E36_003008 [Tilletia maclaganii]